MTGLIRLHAMPRGSSADVNADVVAPLDRDRLRIADPARPRLSRREALQAGIVDLIADCRSPDCPADAMARVREIVAAALPGRPPAGSGARRAAKVAATALREAK